MVDSERIVNTKDIWRGLYQDISQGDVKLCKQTKEPSMFLAGACLCERINPPQLHTDKKICTGG